MPLRSVHKPLILLILLSIGRTVLAAWLDNFSSFGGRQGPLTTQAEVQLSQEKSQFSDLKGIRLDSPKFRTQNGESQKGDYRSNSPAVSLWAAKLTYPFTIFKDSSRRQAALGIALMGPFGELRKFRASTPYDFLPLRDTLTESQFHSAFLGSVALVERALYLRAGLQFFISSSGSAEAILIGNNPTARLAADVGLNSAALAGLSYESANDEFGLAFRQEVAPKIVQRFVGQVSIGNLQTFEQPLEFRTTLYFEPHRFEAYYRHQFSRFSVRAVVNYEIWSRYLPAFLVAETKDAAGKPLITEVPGVRLNNTLSPEVSWHTDTLLPFSLTASYRFSPTPLSDYSGPSNLLDSNLHRINLTVGSDLKGIGLGGWKAELWGQYGWWATQVVKKASADFIGAPGYTIEGNFYRLGTRFSVEL